MAGPGYVDGDGHRFPLTTYGNGAFYPDGGVFGHAGTTMSRALLEALLWKVKRITTGAYSIRVVMTRNGHQTTSWDTSIRAYDITVSIPSFTIDAAYLRDFDQVGRFAVVRKKSIWNGATLAAYPANWVPIAPGLAGTINSGMTVSGSFDWDFTGLAHPGTPHSGTSTFSGVTPTLPAPFLANFQSNFESTEIGGVSNPEAGIYNFGAYHNLMVSYTLTSSEWTPDPGFGFPTFHFFIGLDIVNSIWNTYPPPIATISNYNPYPAAFPLDGLGSSVNLNTDIISGASRESTVLNKDDCDIVGTITSTFTADKFFQYQNRKGELVYDEDTGAQLHDPFG